MSLADLDTVLAIEGCAYSHPWSRGNFADSLAAGHWCTVGHGIEGTLHAYSVAMPALDELHLLNLTVAPPLQGQGLAGVMLEGLYRRCAGDGIAAVLLEVRPSNHRALALYRRHGFESIGLRRGYYPALGAREDALVMRRPVVPGPPHDAGATHALD